MSAAVTLRCDRHACPERISIAEAENTEQARQQAKVIHHWRYQPSQGRDYCPAHARRP